MTVLDRLKELEAKATKGPWQADRNFVDHHHAKSLCSCHTGPADAALIAAVRNALPHLIAVAEAAAMLKEAERVMLDPKSGHGDRSGACDDEKHARRKSDAALAALTKEVADAG